MTAIVRSASARSLRWIPGYTTYVAQMVLILQSQHSAASRGCTNTLALPAVDHNRVVSTPHLHLGHLLNDVSDGLQVGATSISIPVHNVEL